MAEKRYYWLKLHKDFFKRHEIRIIEDMPNGKDYILFYLKLLVESVTHEGALRFSDAIPYNEQMLATITNTNVDIVKAAMQIFIELHMIELLDDQTIFMADVENMIGSETAAAERKRKSRAIQEVEESGKALLPEQKQHIPYIESYMNEKRYNGNYYKVFNRDNCKCVLCGSIEQLCVHHIDGYDKNKPENSNENKMITLCRQCHSQVHRSGRAIPEDTLKSIGYYDGHDDVTVMSQDCHIENRDKSKEIRDKNNTSSTENKSLKIREQIDWSIYNDRELTTVYPFQPQKDLGLTIAEADMLERVVVESALERYYIKVAEYDCKDVFATIIQWAKQDMNYTEYKGEI